MYRQSQYHLSSYIVGISFTDENECNATTYPCHEDAFCNNTIGSFECICEDGFEGNETYCAGLFKAIDRHPSKNSIFMKF